MEPSAYEKMPVSLMIPESVPEEPEILFCPTEFSNSPSWEWGKSWKFSPGMYFHVWKHKAWE